MRGVLSKPAALSTLYSSVESSSLNNLEMINRKKRWTCWDVRTAVKSSVFSLSQQHKVIVHFHFKQLPAFKKTETGEQCYCVRSSQCKHFVCIISAFTYCSISHLLMTLLKKAEWNALKTRISLAHLPAHGTAEFGSRATLRQTRFSSALLPVCQGNETWVLFADCVCATTLAVRSLLVVGDH